MFFNEKDGFCWWLTFAFMMHKFLGGIFSLWVLPVRDRDNFLSQGIFLTIITFKSSWRKTQPSKSEKVPAKFHFFGENLQKIMGDLFEIFDVSLDITTSSICLLKSQRFAQFLCHLIWSRCFNCLVNNVSVVKNFTRFCFSVRYALCIEKKVMVKKVKNPTFLP